MVMRSIFCWMICITIIWGCSSTYDTEKAGFEKIVTSDVSLDIDSFKSSGVKINKQYNVDALPEAVDAWKGVFDQKDVEIRFYISHQDAKTYGVNPAENVTGDDAIVSGNGIIWKEGAKDRRKCVPREATSESGCDQKARFGDFIVFGNTVILCEGLTPEESMTVCYSLKDSIVNGFAK